MNALPKINVTENDFQRAAIAMRQVHPRLPAFYVNQSQETLGVTVGLRKNGVPFEKSMQLPCSTEEVCRAFEDVIEQVRADALMP